jgi:hypothetical protein
MNLLTLGCGEWLCVTTVVYSACLICWACGFLIGRADHRHELKWLRQEVAAALLREHQLCNLLAHRRTRDFTNQN